MAAPSSGQDDLYRVICLPPSRKSAETDEVCEAAKATGVPVKIWVDADACPVVVKDILFRAAKRTKTMMTLVANQPMQVPNSPYIRTIRVASGFDVADNEIVRRLDAGDLVVTGDIPLAAEVIAKGGHALNPRGELYSRENIRARLNMRDFLDTMRASGVMTGGPSALSQRDRQNFANNLDRFLAKSLPE